jgi:hypothetical protein
MSTLRATNIKNPDSGSNNIVLDGSGGVVISGVTTITTLNVSEITGSGLTGAGSTVSDDTTTNATFYPVITQTTTGTITSSKVSTTKLSFNPSSGTLSATSFSGSGSSLTGIPISTGVSGLGTNVATFLATPSSSNLASAVTDETGSGSLVFANSPTLVTPNIGVATGTSLSVSGQLTSTVATGTAPLTVSSTTLVTNLNADLLDGKNTGTSGNTIPLLDGTNTWSGYQTVSATLRVNGSTGLPAAGGGSLYFAGGFNSPTAGKLYIGDATGWEFLMASRSGSVDTTRFTFNDTGSFAATGNVTAYSSDKRLKENFKHIESPLEKVQKLNGYTFDWNKKSEELGFTPQYKQNDVGLIAQEVQAVLPQAAVLAPFDRETNSEGETVSKSGENYLTIQYERLVPLLVEAIKELKEEVNELKARLEEV